MKKIIPFLACLALTAAGPKDQWMCFSFDSMRPGTTTYEAAFHNACVTPITETHLATVAFYNKDNERIDLGTFLIAPLSPGEKVRHLFPMPDAKGVKTIQVKSLKIWP